ncbi:MAG: pantoate--beta-alanine ligase [Chitinophagaceae bacterium]
MILLKKSAQVVNYIIQLKSTGSQIGFVPTMGALHNGHLSLLEKSLMENDETVCSIFVNPTQFNDAHDFRKYPITIEKDLYLLEQAGTHIVFLPDVNEIYPTGINHLQNFDLGALENLLEGAFRPNHFQGVSQVMYRLLNIVHPHNLYMGQKDYQQCMLVQRLLQIMKVNITLKICPTQRETDGLAMSSRNMRLNDDERKKAVTISKVLAFFKENLRPGDLSPIINKGKEMLDQNQFKTDYVQVSDAHTLEKVSNWDGKQSLVALIAAFINEVRLIDNMILTG